MSEFISKDELDNLLNIKGKMRGFAMKPVLDFVLEREGQGGFDKLIKIMISLGSPVDYRNIKPFNYYPLNWQTVLFLMVKKIFNYSDQDFQKMGSFSAKAPSAIRRIVMQSLYSRYSDAVPSKETLNKLGKVWNKFIDVGSFQITSINMKKKEIIVQFKDIFFHPIVCQIMIGYLVSVIKVIAKDEVTCEQIKKGYEGDECDEFLLKW